MMKKQGKKTIVVYLTLSISLASFSFSLSQTTFFLDLSLCVCFIVYQICQRLDSALLPPNFQIC
jgi:uncharacterized membrane protein